MSNTDLAALAAELKAKGVRALTVTWCDSNGIQRSRTAPIDKLASAVERGMGCSFLFAVFDSHDHIHWGVEGVNTPTGDFRLKYKIFVDPPAAEHDFDKPVIKVELSGSDSPLVLERGGERPGHCVVGKSESFADRGDRGRVGA